MRFHMVGLWHTSTHLKYNACAFSSHIYKLSKGLYERGHEVYHYGNPGSELICTEHIDVVSKEYSQRYLPDNNPEIHKDLYNYDYIPETYTFYMGCVAQIRERIQPEDYVSINIGAYNNYIIDGLDDIKDFPIFICETRVGYHDTWQSPYRTFDSNSIRDWNRAQWHENWKRHYEKNPDSEPPKWAKHECEPHWLDDTIPVSVIPEQFEYKPKKEDYFLFLGRIITSKGLNIAVKTCEEIGAHLIVAGQGDLEDALGYKPPDCVEFIGHADTETRKKLMANAKGGFVCTYYSEPGGTVVHEYGVSGTPVIATNWGSFTQSVLHGKTGFLIQDGAEAIWAAENIESLDSADCRKWNMNFSLDKQMDRYEAYFERIAHIHKNDGDPLKKHPVKDLSYREMIYPDDPNYDINLERL